MNYCLRLNIYHLREDLPFRRQEIHPLFLHHENYPIYKISFRDFLARPEVFGDFFQGPFQLGIIKEGPFTCVFMCGSSLWT